MGSCAWSGQACFMASRSAFTLSLKLPFRRADRVSHRFPSVSRPPNSW